MLITVAGLGQALGLANPSNGRYGAVLAKVEVDTFEYTGPQRCNLIGSESQLWGSQRVVIMRSLSSLTRTSSTTERQISCQLILDLHFTESVCKLVLRGKLQVHP